MDLIKVLSKRSHSKASEKYVDVVFTYDEFKFETSIPYEYRRTGTSIEEAKIDNYLGQIYEEVSPKNWDTWKKEQIGFWLEKPGATVTKSFFDILSSKFDWCCVTCNLPQNPNWARRVQDLKEFGYTLATNTNRACKSCKRNSTQLILVPIKRGGITGYEVWSPSLRKRILSLLNNFDAYEGKISRPESLLPDHKFPEIRWDAKTKRHNLETLTDEEIIRDFQLITNQRNQQKREVCRSCYQTSNRGMLYGIRFFYSGGETWDPKIPKNGKEAEAGCKGCGWYDINLWRSEIIKKIEQSNKK